MQVPSAGHSRAFGVPLALQSARTRGNSDYAVEPVSHRSRPHEEIPHSTPEPQPRIEIDAGTEKKLNRIKEVQVAFTAALNIADSIDSQYLLDPII